MRKDVIALLIVVIILSFGGIWYYFVRPQTATTTSKNEMSSTSADSFFLIHPTGTTATKIGPMGGQFKIQYIAVANVDPKTDIGCSSVFAPFFKKYFYIDSNSGFCYNALPADGGQYIKIVDLNLNLYAGVPALIMSYPVTNPDSGAIDYIPASTFLPFEGGYLESTPVGSIHPTERIVFVMPTEEKEAIVSYAGGKININLQDRTANLSPGSQ